MVVGRGRWRSIVEFLVHIEVLWPPDADPDEKARLIAAEGARARELIAEGRIRRLWRIPGRWANYGLWEAPDATVLHAALSSLPLSPWCDIEVEPLATHPSDPGPAVAGGPGPTA
jgi:muconolactone D-isomerase